MRILFLNHNVVRKGGTFYRAYHIARHLVLRGHSVTLMSISPDQRMGFRVQKSEGVEIVETPDLLWGVGRTGWDLWDTLRRIVYLRAKQWDVIHAWDCRPVVILPALFARSRSVGTGGSLVIDWCDWWGRGGTQAERPGHLFKLIYGPIETFFEESFRNRADGTTVASQALRERVLSLGVSAHQVLMLPGGSDTKAIKPMERRSARERLRLSFDNYWVGYMGALTLKESELLMEALMLARQRIPSLHFLAIGASIAGANLTLRSAVGQRWTDWMVDTGRIPYQEVGTYLSACDLLLLPMCNNVSSTARWPSKINDYLAAVRPIVATRVGEIVPLFANGIGLLTSPDAKAFSQGIVTLAQDLEAAEKAGKRSRGLAEGQFNWEVLVQGLDHFYDRIRGYQRSYSVKGAAVHKTISI